MSSNNKLHELNDLLGPYELAAAYRAYRPSRKLPAEINCSNAGEDYIKTRKAKRDFYKGIAFSDKTTVSSKMGSRTPEQQKIIEDQINTVLALQSDTDKALKHFKHSIMALNKILTEETPVFSALSITDHLHKCKSDCLKKIEDQQKIEIEQLSNSFNLDSSFKKEIASALDATTPERTDALKNQFVEALKTQHAEQIKAFEKSVNAEIEALHKLNALEVRRISYLANMLHYREKSNFNPVRWVKESKFVNKYLSAQTPKKMQDEINKKIQAETQKLHPKDSKQLMLSHNTAELDFDDGNIGLRNITLEDLETIQSITGREFTVKKDKNIKKNCSSNCFGGRFDASNLANITVIRQHNYNKSLNFREYRKSS